MPSEPAIVFDHLDVTLDGQEFLCEISEEIRQGEIFLVFGPYGCGKSLFPRIILGLIRATGGCVRVLGQDVAALPRQALYEMRMDLGFVPRENHLIHNLTVFENVALPLAYRRRTTKALLRQRVTGLIDFLGLGAVASLRPHQLQRLTEKKVALAQALVCRPRIILIDGPYAGMDALVAEKLNILFFRDAVRWWQDNPLDGEGGADRPTFFLSCTVLHSLPRHIDRAAMLYDRRFVFRGRREEMPTTDNPYVRQFLDVRTDGPIQYLGI